MHWNRKWSRGESNPRPLECDPSAVLRQPATHAYKRPEPRCLPGAVLHAVACCRQAFAERTRRVRRDRFLRQRLKSGLGSPGLLRAVDDGRTGDLVLGKRLDSGHQPIRAHRTQGFSPVLRRSREIRWAPMAPNPVQRRYNARLPGRRGWATPFTGAASFSSTIVSCQGLVSIWEAARCTIAPKRDATGTPPPDAANPPTSAVKPDPTPRWAAAVG